MTTKMAAGTEFPTLDVHDMEGEVTDISRAKGECDWRLLVVYRGQHCPLCKKYLRQLDELAPKFKDIGIDVVAVSGDSPSQLRAFAKDVDVSFPIYSSLSIDQMKSLGLYVSHPRHKEETDHPFPEPGLFVITDEGQVQIADVSNAPFSRPDLNSLLGGLQFIRENDYPIRGTYLD